MNRVLTAVLAAMAGGCTYLPFLQVAPADYHYVLVGPDGILVARAITADAACPALELDGVHPTVLVPPNVLAVCRGNGAPPPSSPR